jgi:hypothetical protein
MDIFYAGKLFILLTIFLITSGTFALNYALYRQLNGPALCFLFIFNGIFWNGFLPYLFSIGVTLWATAGWIALRNRPWPLRFLFSAGAVAVLCLSHPTSVGLYLMAISCYEASRVRWTDLNWRQIGLDAVVMTVPFLVVLPMVLSSQTSHDLSNISWEPLTQKWVGPYLVFRSANLVLDALFACFLILFLGCLVYLRRLQGTRVFWLFLGLSGLTYLLIPSALYYKDWEGTDLDLRLPLAFVFLLIGLVRWRLGSPRAALVFSSLIAIVLAVRVGGVALAWQAYSRIVSEYEASFAHIEPGSRVLVVSDLSAGWQGSGNRVTLAMDRDAIGHMPALAAIERSSLVSDVFGDPNARLYGVLRVKAPYRSAIPSHEVTVERLASLLPNASGPLAAETPARDEQLDEELKSWPQNYDYVYVQYASPGTQLQLPGVRLLYQASSFQLYKIESPGQ